MADPGVIALATELTGQTRLSDADWNKVEATAQALANALRVKNSAHLLFTLGFPQNQDDAPQMILRKRWETQNCPLSWQRQSRTSYEDCVYPMSLISLHCTRSFAWELMFALTTVRPASSLPFAPNNPSQTKTEATSSTLDFSTHSLPYSSATPTSSPRINPLIFSHFPWHI
jgi:hypothetical protein